MNKEYIENILNCSIGTILRVGKIMLGAFIVMVLLAVIYKVFAIDRVDVNSEAVINDSECYAMRNSHSEKDQLVCFKPIDYSKVNQINIISGGFGDWTMPSMSDVKNAVQGAFAYPFNFGSAMAVKASKYVVSVKDKVVSAFKTKDDVPENNNLRSQVTENSSVTDGDDGLTVSVGSWEFVSRQELIESLKEVSKEGLERGHYAFSLATESMGAASSKAMTFINEWE